MLVCMQLQVEEWTVEVPEDYTDPDVLLTLNTTSKTAYLRMYCNPTYGSFVNNGTRTATWASGEPQALLIHPKQFAGLPPD